jgi:predicted nucleotidyltransferase component of viral defense system
VTAKKVSPIAHSVHDRLLKLAASGKEDFNAILVRYGNERILYRLTRTRHASRFTLKGASLFVLWLGQVHRPTRDLDLLGSGTINQATLTNVFEDVCSVAVEPDGLEFDKTSITVAEIREGQEYQGLRIKLLGQLGTARLSIQIDVGLGDAVTPTPQEAEYPTLLDMPAPKMKVYPRETAIAEKLDAMIELGMKNSRMKDYYDIALLAHHFEFDGASLCRAIEATLRRRGRAIPTQPPMGLTQAFGSDANKVIQWKAFIKNHPSSELPSDLGTVVQHVAGFLEPPVSALAAGQSFKMKWSPAGPWR